MLISQVDKWCFIVYTIIHEKFGDLFANELWYVIGDQRLLAVKEVDDVLLDESFHIRFFLDPFSKVVGGTIIISFLARADAMEPTILYFLRK